eukprot:TRINITY_DN503_c0_g1_i3.p1 TRINITY_DN503_c0_g1~~TRINITY_DN503_c0_g1_i3.p1  ORF type:complete len:303 (+),score=37.26 TRINITY_DN503_c0_g1_i3:1057-1965(+)
MHIRLSKTCGLPLTPGARCALLCGLPADPRRHDVVAHIRAGEKVALRLHPVARMVPFPGGHMICMERAGDVNDALVELFEATHMGLSADEWVKGSSLWEKVKREGVHSVDTHEHLSCCYYSCPRMSRNVEICCTSAGGLRFVSDRELQMMTASFPLSVSSLGQFCQDLRHGDRRMLSASTRGMMRLCYRSMTWLRRVMLLAVKNSMWASCLVPFVTLRRKQSLSELGDDEALMKEISVPEKSNSEGREMVSRRIVGEEEEKERSWGREMGKGWREDIGVEGGNLGNEAEKESGKIANGNERG